MTPMTDKTQISCMYDKSEADAVSLALSAAKETADQAKVATDRLIAELNAIAKDTERRTCDAESRLSVLDALLVEVKNSSIERFAAQRESVALALAAAKETTEIAQMTADRAVAKAEAAAGKEYLESQIEGLRSSFTAQIVAQKEAINAALVAAKDALTAALASAEKAIAKAEEASNKRFDAITEAMKALTNQTSTFIARNEYSVQYTSIADRLTSLESRIDKGEGVSRGSDRTTERSDRSSDRSSVVVSQVIAGFVAFVIVMTAVVSVVAFVLTRP